MTPIRIETDVSIPNMEVGIQTKPSPSPEFLFNRPVVVGHPLPQPSPMTRREFLQTTGTALGALFLAPVIRLPDPLPTSPVKKPPESNLLSDLLLSKYLESGNIDDLQQFIPEAGHQTEDELSLFLSPDIPFDVWTGDQTDMDHIIPEAFTKTTSIQSVSQAHGYPSRLFEKMIGKAEKAGELKKLSNHMFGVGTDYDGKWYVSDDARREQNAANRITNGHISVDRMLFDDQGNLILVGRKRMEPLVVKRSVKKFGYWNDQILDINDQATDQDVNESNLPEITFAVKVNIKHLPFDVWGGKHDDSKSLLDCQAVLIGNWLESMRQTKNLLLQREIVAWPRVKLEKFWDNIGSVNISNKIGAAVNADPNVNWQIEGHLAPSVYYDPAIYDFDHPPMDDSHTRAFVSGALVKIPVGAKLFLHGLQRRTNGEFIALVEAKDETYAPGNLPEPLYSSVFDFRNRYRGKFFWVSHKDLQSPVVKIK